MTILSTGGHLLVVSPLTVDTILTCPCQYLPNAPYVVCYSRSHCRRSSLPFPPLQSDGALNALCGWQKLYTMSVQAHAHFKASTVLAYPSVFRVKRQLWRSAVLLSRSICEVLIFPPRPLRTSSSSPKTTRSSTRTTLPPRRYFTMHNAGP